MNKLESIFQGIEKYQVGNNTYQTDSLGSSIYGISLLEEDSWLFYGKVCASNHDEAIKKFICNQQDLILYSETH